MSGTFDFLTTTDKPALLALSTPEWQELARAALTELGYKVHTAAAHGDFIANFTQVPYQVVIIEECFAADTAPENRSLTFLQAAPMNLRRHTTLILVGDSYTSFNPMQAFQLGAVLSGGLGVGVVVAGEGLHLFGRERLVLVEFERGGAPGVEAIIL